MLQQAANSAYSWWWASHVRANQSKWLDDNLREMEETVHTMLTLLGEEAESFAKRADMYYKKRPEVIKHVQELHRTYRALVERYDLISKELSKANQTIASHLPDQVQYALLEDATAGGSAPKALTLVDARRVHKPTVDKFAKKQKKKPEQGDDRRQKYGTQMNKEKAEQEISRLQKTILVLQKEEIYWLQDEYSASSSIEDDDARALMMATALKSCEAMVMKLQERLF